MTRWEYCQLMAFRSRARRDADDQWMHWLQSADGTNRKLHEEPMAIQNPLPYLRDLGADGWELVQVEAWNAVFGGSGFDNMADAVVRRFWLKRPLD